MVIEAASVKPGGGVDFSDCLTLLEGDNQEQRLTALQKLGTRLEERSLAVILRLTEDENPDIKRHALALARRFKELDVRQRLSQAQSPGRERFSIAGSYQLVDEVFAIWANRAWDYLLTAGIAGAPKLALIFILLSSLGPAQPFSFFIARNEIWFISILVIVHTVVFRPFAWELLGKTFLAGWPERSLRRRFQRRLTLGSYVLLLRGGLLTSLQYLAVLGGGLILPMVQNAEPFMLLLCLFYLLLPWNFCRFAMALLHPLTPDAFAKAMELAWTNTSTIRSQLSDFCWFLAWIYAAFIASFLGVATFFVRYTEPVHYFCGLLLADVLLDPIWVGFHLMLTRMLEERKPA